VSIADSLVRSISKSGQMAWQPESSIPSDNRTEITMSTITSADGTTIAYDRIGAGDPLILIGGAFSYRRYPGQVKLANLLAARWTVYSYDRRGRGDSGDGREYAIEREIEDLSAVIGAAGGHAHAWGLSSGAVLALDAVAAGLPIRKVAVQEPPLVVSPADRRPPADLCQRLTDLIRAGQRGEAVRYFMVDGMGAPAVMPALLRLLPGAWKQLTAVAHTLPYDARLIEPYLAGRPLPDGQWATVKVPTLVMCGVEKESPAFLLHAAAAVAAALPDARLVQSRGLGHTKALNAKAIAAALTGFLADQDSTGTGGISGQAMTARKRNNDG
jgi:pimeloyl-ACP methyl ester carboxylesterase